MINRALQLGAIALILTGCSSNSQHSNVPNNQNNSIKNNNTPVNKHATNIKEVSGKSIYSKNISGGNIKILIGGVHWKIVYNNKVIKKGFGPISVRKIFSEGKSSIILIEDNSNGTACPYRYFFITTHSDGNYTMTKEFGTCGNINSIKPNGENILIGLNVIQNGLSPQDSKLVGITYYIYSDGSVTKMTNIRYNKDMTHSSINTTNRYNSNNPPFKVGFRKERVNVFGIYTEEKQLRITSLSNKLILTGIRLNKGNCRYLEKSSFKSGILHDIPIFPWPLKYGDNAKIIVTCTPERMRLFTNEGSYVFTQT